MAEQNKEKTIEMIDDVELERIYANYVSVTTAPHECNITFCRIDPLKNAPNKIKAPVVAKIMIPNSLVPELIEVIKMNFNKVMDQLHKLQEEQKGEAKAKPAKK